MKTKQTKELTWYLQSISLFAQCNIVQAEVIFRELRRIEAKERHRAEMQCNGAINETEEETEAKDKKTLSRLKQLLPGVTDIFINGDPRGFALKINIEATRILRNKGIYIETDWGGYGILAPKF